MYGGGVHAGEYVSKPFLRHEFIAVFQVMIFNSFKTHKHIHRGAGCVHLPKARGHIIGLPGPNG